MADAPEKGKTGTTRRPPGQEKAQRREAGGRGASGAGAEASREDLDPREEEGWTQPESSAQKGALPDEG